MKSFLRPGQFQSLVQSPVRSLVESPVQSLTGSRLRKHADYLRAYAAARKRQSASMSWFLAPQTLVTPQTPQILEAQSSGLPGPHERRLVSGLVPGLVPGLVSGLVPRVGLTVGKVIGKATERNRIKRRMRDVLRRHLGLLPPGCDLIFHPRRVVLTMQFAQLEAEIVRILEQAGTEAARGFKLPAAALKAPGPPAP
jgi:ribonuclease P protein component